MSDSTNPGTENETAAPTPAKPTLATVLGMLGSVDRRLRRLEQIASKYHSGDLDDFDAAEPAGNSDRE